MTELWSFLFFEAGRHLFVAKQNLLTFSLSDIFFVIFIFLAFLHFWHFYISDNFIFLTLYFDCNVGTLGEYRRLEGPDWMMIGGKNKNHLWVGVRNMQGGWMKISWNLWNINKTNLNDILEKYVWLTFSLHTVEHEQKFMFHIDFVWRWTLKLVIEPDL